MWPAFQLGAVSRATWRYALRVGAALRHNRLCLGASQLSGRLYAARWTRNIRSTRRRVPSDRHSYAHADSHADPDYPRRHAADANSDRTQLYSNTHAGRDPNAYHRPRSDADVHADRDRHAAATYANTHRQSERATLGYAGAAICNADRDATANCNAFADRYAVANCDAATAYCDPGGKHLAAGCGAVAFARVTISSEKLACPCRTLHKGGHSDTHRHAQTPV